MWKIFAALSQIKICIYVENICCFITDKNVEVCAGEARNGKGVRSCKKLKQT